MLANGNIVHISFIKKILYFILDMIPDKYYLKMRFYFSHGKRLNLKKPVTYSEKLQWLKLYDRNPLYTRLVDKYEMKNIVADIIGNEYLIKTLGIYDTFDQIDFSVLPQQFVLKCTHDSGSVIICRNKSTFDIQNAKIKIERAMKINFYHGGREWPYKNVKPRIIIEEYIEDSVDKELRDYKFFCFAGEPKLFFIATDRETKEKDTCFDFFDMDYNHINVKNGHPNAKIIPHKPEKFDEMKSLSKKLCEGLDHYSVDKNNKPLLIPQLRVDFYCANGKIYIGELTLFHHSGFMPFEPEEWDYKMGEWTILPKKNREMSK